MAKPTGKKTEQPKPWEEKETKFSQLPVISFMEQEDMEESIRAMKAHVALGEEIRELTERRDAIGELLEETAEKYGQGFRWGKFGTYYTQGTMRKLTSERLIEQVVVCRKCGTKNPITVDHIEAAKEPTPFTRLLVKYVDD